MKSFEEVTHAEMVSILAKGGDLIIAEMTPLKAHLLHMSFCLMEEAEELIDYTDIENLVEEVGDSMFYLEGLTQGLSEYFSRDMKKFNSADIRTEVLNNALNFTFDSVIIYAAKLAGALKPLFFYNKTLDYNAVCAALYEYKFVLATVTGVLGVSIVDAATANKKKLSKRYAKLEFSNEQAQERADKK